ncbi:hypothetical protein MY1884_006551 [Beauveria asiatica]
MLKSHLDAEKESRVHLEHDHMKHLTAKIAKAKRIVAFAGAGISTKAGIKGYHSKNGRYANGNLFLRSSLGTQDGRGKFMEHAVSLRDAALKARPTETHEYLRELWKAEKLRRLYSQNVDGLEAVAGLSTGMTAEPDAPPICILLHGAIRTLRCELCCSTVDWKGHELDTAKLSLDPGTELNCPTCQQNCKNRTDLGKRKTRIGRLYPAIICSDDEHPQGVEIEDVIAQDEKLADMLIILGTSLRFKGPEKLAQRFARSVRAKQGTIVYVNKTKPPRRIMQFVDDWVNSKCDTWAREVQRRMSRGIGGEH